MPSFFARRASLGLFADLGKAANTDALIAIQQASLVHPHANALITFTNDTKTSTIAVTAPQGVILRETLATGCTYLAAKLRLRDRLRLAWSYLRQPRKTRAEEQTILSGFDAVLYEHSNDDLSVTLTCNRRLGWTSGTSSLQCNEHRHATRVIAARSAEQILSGMFNALYL